MRRPTHFDWKGQRRMGATVMKHRHLQRLGFRVMSVSYREWEDAGKGERGGENVQEARRALLRRKIAHALK